MFMNLLLHPEDVIAVDTRDVSAVSVSERAKAPRKRDFRINIQLD